MDGLSAVASVIAVLQLTGSVITYLNDVKNAPKECQQCTIEASNLQNLLINLRYRLEQAGEQGEERDPWYTALHALAVENGPLDQYKYTLEQLLSKVEVRNAGHSIRKRLSWTFSKNEAAHIIERMERLKSLISVALEMDHFKLSQAIIAQTTAIQSTLPELQASTVATEINTVTIRDTQNVQQHNALMEWLSPKDFSSQQHDIIARRETGTGQWFLKSVEFKRWSDGLDKTLFCPGIPGAGKTMMAAISIDHLCRTARSRDVEVAYLFCSYKGTAKLNASEYFAAILRQLVQSRSEISAPVRNLYARQRTRPSLDELLSIIQIVCRNYVTVYIIVDALDECTNKDGTREKLIYELRELQVAASVDLRLMFTSRFIPDITQNFQSNLKLEVKASEEDLSHFVAGQIPRLPKCIQRDSELKQIVQNKIISAVDGMFLLARLRVDSLLGHTTKKKILLKLDTFNRGADALDRAYSDALDRIDGQLDGYRELARRALSWITYAQRLLNTQELCHALAIEPETISLDLDNVPEIEDIISVCAGLVTVDEESSIVRLVHYTTQEYLEQVRLKWIPEAQTDIAEACLTYLSFDTFRNGGCNTNEALEERVVANPFFDYASRFWADHLRPIECDVSDLALNFLRNDALVQSTAQSAFVPARRLEYFSKKYKTERNGLHMTAFYGLFNLTGELLKDKTITADLKDTDGRTPLSWAAFHGHESIVQLLISRNDVEVDSKDNYRQTPLSLAANRGHEAVVRLLISRNDVDADWKDSAKRTPLSRAASNGHEAIVRLLILREDVDADSEDCNNRTPLSWAAMGGHEAVVQLLLSHADFDPDMMDQFGRTPLSLAAGHGNEAVVRLLVSRDDVDANSKDDQDWTPLSWSAKNGHEAVVRLLISCDDVQANSQDWNGETPLSGAAANGHQAVVRLLISSNDVKTDLKNNAGRTPLSRAAGKGHKEVVQLLLSCDDVEADSKDHNGRTPLSWSAQGGHEEVVQLLLSRDDVEADSKDFKGRTPLAWSAKEGQEAIVRLLGERDDVEVNSKDYLNKTPLSHAAEEGHMGVVDLLELYKMGIKLH